MQVFPPVKPSDPSTWPGYGWHRWAGPITPEVAQSIPGVARGVQLISGQAMQMPMDDYRGVEPLARPRLLDQPDPEQSRAWFVGVQWEDFLLNGNALCYVTSRDAEGWPSTVAWLPAAWTTVTVDPRTWEPSYWVGGTQLETGDVVHVRRSADRYQGIRGVGIVEQHLDAIGKVRDQHRHEAEVLQSSAVPSVAIITPNPRLSKTEADEAKNDWLERFRGPDRKPAILPSGTEVIPLAWSPSDSQLVEARQLSLTDIANMLNLDGYWLGAPAGSMTYRSPGPMYLNLLRQTIGPIAEVFEDVWSASWLPHGRRVRFDRRRVLADDMGTMIDTAQTAVDAGLWTVEEARVYLGMPPQIPEGQTIRTVTSPVATIDADPDEDDEDDEDEEEGDLP